MPQSPLSPIVTVGVAGLEAAINATLKLDPALKEKITSMEGKSVALACTDPTMTLTIVLGEHCTILQSIELDDTMVTASLCGTPSAWFELIRSSDKAATLINGDLQLKGDSRLFQELGSIAEDIDIDWESWLAERIGDVPTHLAARTVEKTQEFGQAAKTHLEGFMHDFLHSEKSPVTTVAQSDELYRELRNLEMKIDRLDAKVKAINS